MEFMGTSVLGRRYILYHARIQLLTQTMSDPPKRCLAVVYIRDTYRHTERGKNVFELHCIRKQCSRTATHAGGYCWQHARNRPDLAAESQGG